MVTHLIEARSISWAVITNTRTAFWTLVQSWNPTTVTEAFPFSVSAAFLDILALMAWATASLWMETRLTLKLLELMELFRPTARLCLKSASEVLPCSHLSSPSSSSMWDLRNRQTPTRSYSCSRTELFTICLLQSIWSVSWLNVPALSSSWVSVTPTSQLWRNLMVMMAVFVTHVVDFALAISSNSSSLTPQCVEETWPSKYWRRSLIRYAPTWRVWVSYPWL